MPHTIDKAHPGEPELKGSGHVASPSLVEPLSPERLQRAREAHRSYYRWLRLRRLALVAFFVMATLFLLWVLPWLPAGLDTDDYTPQLAFTVYLLGAVAVTGALALASRELVRRERERLMVWAAVYDETTGLHSRTYLYDRLSLECERAERGSDGFSVLTLQIRIGSPASVSPPTLSNAALERVAELVDRLTHPGDLVALLSGSELAILAIGVDQADRRPLLERLRAAVAAELPQFLNGLAIVDVIGGAATYGVEGKEPGVLIQAARTAATLALPRRGQAA